MQFLTECLGPSRPQRYGAGGAIGKSVAVLVRRIEFAHKSRELAQDHWITGRGFYCFLRQRHQGLGMETGSKALDPLRGNDPVAVATSTRQQIYLLFYAFTKSFAQFSVQRGIFPGRRRQCCRKGTIFESHSCPIDPTQLM